MIIILFYRNNMALFGIPMVGADICGFQGTTTEELCARWIEVGAFSPFSRDHNIRKAPPQELYRWDSVAEAGRSALSLRYKLLPYLYTLMYRAHERGTTVHNALWMHFPDDSTTLLQDQQFMWADGILFTPVVTEGATSVIGYFPRGAWYSLFSDDVIDATNGGVFVELQTPLTATNVHVRGGKVIAMQEAAMTTSDARQTPFDLLIALDENGSASGDLFLDNGIQVELNETTELQYSVSNGLFRSTLVRSTYHSEAIIDSLTILSLHRHSGSSEAHCSARINVTEEGVEKSYALASIVTTELGAMDKIVFNFGKLLGNVSVKIASSFEIEIKC
jgi:alpha-glucosidase